MYMKFLDVLNRSSSRESGVTNTKRYKSVCYEQ